MKVLYGVLIAVAVVASLVLTLETLKAQKIRACESRNGIPLFSRIGSYRACAAAVITWGE